MSPVKPAKLGMKLQEGKPPAEPRPADEYDYKQVKPMNPDRKMMQPNRGLRDFIMMKAIDRKAGGKT